jgi:hypothetical protein
MKNCNWRTKLKKNFYKRNKNDIKSKRMRTKIENQTTKRTMMYFSYQERERKGKNKNKRPSTKIRPHAAHQVEKETIAHLVRQRIARFGHRVVSHTPPKWCRHHQLASTFGRCADRFLNKKLERQREKYQNTPMNLLITQNTRMKISKYPQRKSLFFCFF